MPEFGGSPLMHAALLAVLPVAQQAVWGQPAC